MGAELFASATCEIDDKSMDCQFHCQLSEITLALMKGKTVILKGELSLYAYAAIQNLFNAAQINYPTGRASISVRPFNYCDAKIKLSYPGCRSDWPPETLIDSQLWEQYENSLLDPDDKQSTLYKNFTKLKSLANFIQSLPHNGLDTPPNGDFTFDQLKEMLIILENGDEKRDNPVKSVFLNRYEKSSETYALINVICKLLFSTKTEGGIRYEKLQKYPEDLSYLWRRLNCLSAVELRKFFQYDIPKFALRRGLIIPLKK